VGPGQRLDRVRQQFGRILIHPEDKKAARRRPGGFLIGREQVPLELELDRAEDLGSRQGDDSLERVGRD